MHNMKINWLAIITATLVGQIIGMGWYSFFSEQWMDYHGLNQEFMEENFSPIPFIVSIIASLIMYYIMAILFQRIGVDTAKKGLIIGFLLALAFGFLPPYTQGHFEFNVNSGLIDAGNNFFGILAGGLILGAWTKKED